MIGSGRYGPDRLQDASFHSKNETAKDQKSSAVWRSSLRQRLANP